MPAAEADWSAARRSDPGSNADGRGPGCVPALSPLARAAFCLASLIVPCIALAQATPPKAKAENASEYRLPEIPSEFAGEDAIILEWRQHHKSQSDGRTELTERKRVLVRHDRSYGAFADPRITYHADFETVDIRSARTILSDGRVLPVPAYSINEVSPGETAGWPDFAAIRQKVISFSGVEPGAILELEYTRSTRPGMRAAIEVDERVCGDYPIIERAVTVTAGGVHGSDWSHVAPCRDETLSIPWRERCAAHRDCRDVDSGAALDCAASARRILGAMEAAAATTASIRALAEEWKGGKSDPLERIRQIRERLNKRISIVHARPNWVPDALRTADRVRETTYGTPAEAAALFLALVRAAGVVAEPMFVCDEGFTGGESPLPRSAIVAFGIAVRVDGELSWWHLGDGRIRNPGHWGGRQLCHGAILTGKADAAVSRPSGASDLHLVALRSLGDISGSRFHVGGDVDLSGDGNWTARLDIRATGLFVRADDLLTDDQKRGTVQGWLDRILPDAHLERYSVTALSDDVFGAKVEAKSRAPLRAVDAARVLVLPQPAPWTTRFDLPLSRSERRTALRLPGAFRQDVQLSFALPGGWAASAAPHSLESAAGPWGATRQDVKVESGRIRFAQSVECRTRDIPVEQYGSLRSAFNRLQTPAARTWVFAPAEKGAAAANEGTSTADSAK